MANRPVVLLLLVGTLLGCSLLPVSYAAATPGTLTITSPSAGTTLYRTEGYTIAGTVTPVVLPDNVLIEVSPPGSSTVVDVQTVALAANGSYSYKTSVGGNSEWTPGTYTISVSDSNGASATSSFVYSSSGAPTSTKVSPAQSSVKGGVPLFYTVKVSDSEVLGSSPSGAVSWSDGGAGGAFQSTSCNLSSLGNETSTCTVLYTPSSTSSVTITADYPGDSLRASSSGTASLSVTQDATATNVSASARAAGPGTMVTLSAAVEDTSSSPTFPAANVTWSDNGAGGSFSSSTCALYSTAPATSSCQVTYTVPSGLNQVKITATYAGDAGHLASSGQVTIDVTGSTSTSTSVSASSSSATSSSSTSTSSLSTNSTLSSSLSSSTTATTSNSSVNSVSTSTNTTPSTTSSSSSGSVAIESSYLGVIVTSMALLGAAIAGAPRRRDRRRALTG